MPIGKNVNKAKKISFQIIIERIVFHINKNALIYVEF